MMPTEAEIAEWTAGYRSARVPTVVLWGGLDRVPRSHADRLVDALPGARLVVFDEVGHAPQLEDPERCLAEILRFLRGADRRRARRDDGRSGVAEQRGGLSSRRERILDPFLPLPRRTPQPKRGSR